MARPPIPAPKLYQLSGPLGGNGDGYRLDICGPTINAASFRQLIKILEMTAGWLKEDERAGIVDPVAQRVADLQADAAETAPHTVDRTQNERSNTDEK